MDAFKISRVIKNCIITAALVLCAIPLAQIGFETANSINKKLYKTPAYSQENFEAAFKEEKKKLGLENLAINLEVVDDPNFVSRCWYYNPNKIEILVGKNYMKKGVLKHALYHANRMRNGYITKEREHWNPLHTLEDWKATSYALEE